MTWVLIAAVVLFGLPTFYLACRSRELRKFLAGAFFVSGGIQLYLCAVQVTVPLLGSTAVQTPQLSGARGGLHMALFLLCLYTGFLRAPKGS